MESLLKPNEELYRRVINEAEQRQTAHGPRRFFGDRDEAGWSEAAQEVETGAEAPGLTDYTVPEMFQIARILYMLDRPAEFRAQMIEETVAEALEGMPPQVTGDAELVGGIRQLFGTLYDLCAAMRARGMTEDDMVKHLGPLFARTGFVASLDEVRKLAASG